MGVDSCGILLFPPSRPTPAAASQRLDNRGEERNTPLELAGRGIDGDKKQADSVARHTHTAKTRMPG